jgi:hypothetical protein
MKKIFYTLFVLAIATLPQLASAATTVVSPANYNGWTSTTTPIADTRPGGTASLIPDATAPLSEGALRLTTDSTTAAKAQFMTANYAGTLLSSITELSYATKKNSGPATAAASFQLGIDLDGDLTTITDRTTLVYEPYWNGTVTSDWQTWDVNAGQFWSSRTVGDLVNGVGGPPFYTLSTIVANHPNARVTVTGVNVGSWNPDYDVETDAFNFNGTTYDFEPASTVVVVTGNTAVGENQPGWMFNRDTNTDTPFTFNTDVSRIGVGSLYVFPIGANASDKFIAENFINTPIANVNSISYDFRIASTSLATQEEQFYMNVYANFGESNDLKFYDCRYNIIPTTGSNTDFTTLTFDPTQSYPVDQRNTSPHTCPSVPADMDALSAGSNIRVFSLNVGDTSASDVGVNGYLDNVVTNLDSGVTVYDFEPIDLDADDDGVNDTEDICSGTNVDNWGSAGLGTNRWELGTGNEWFQNMPVSKKSGTGGYTASTTLTVEDTYGCSGKQIIGLVSELTDEDMNGHVTYGLSTGLLQTFIEDGKDGVIDGINSEATPLETVVVPATSTGGVMSTSVLALGKEYVLRASGTANAADGIDFDADYSFRIPTSVTWTDAVNTYEYLGDTLLDLKVDDAFVDWDTDAIYNTDHTYSRTYVGTGLPVSFGIYDVAPENNTGSLSVSIYAKLW